ncbi:MAG TPA: DUF3570 domain-containing protein [Polyangia bacterium]|nr:DUF3570 domain-containing protein [Polyangia bacterium]
MASVSEPAPPPRYQIESVRFRFTHHVQTGVGYQSAAGPMGEPGSERATIEQPQAEVVAHLGDRLTQRVWVPIDVITAASPDHSRFGRPRDDPPDAISTASRVNVAGSLDTLSTYRWDATTDVSFRAALHLEEPFESWAFGMGLTRSLAEDNTVVGISANQVVDWFDSFNLAGDRNGRANRSTTNLNFTLTQLLSPTTIVALSYGGTMQLGTLGNTWSSVLLADGNRGDERLPWHRQRHALAGRLAQWLPWEGAVKVAYRAYHDDWGITGHTLEGDLVQRLRPWLHMRASYRYHHQSQATFFTTNADPADDGFRTADSDLDAFHAQTIGGAISVELPLARRLHSLHADLGYEHYFRSNHLTVRMTTCALGLRF